MDEEIFSKLKFLDASKSKRSNWNISWVLCSFISNFVRIIKPKSILEIGTSNGFSTLCIVRFLERGTYKLKTLEINIERAEEAKKNFKSLNLNDIEIINEDVFNFLSRKSNTFFDFIFIDAVQNSYIDLIKLLIKNKYLDNKSIIICDNLNSHNNMEEFKKYMFDNFDCSILNIDTGFLIARNLKLN